MPLSLESLNRPSGSAFKLFCSDSLSNSLYVLAILFLFFKSYIPAGEVSLGLLSSI